MTEVTANTPFNASVKCNMSPFGLGERECDAMVVFGPNDDPESIEISFPLPQDKMADLYSQAALDIDRYFASPDFSGQLSQGNTAFRGRFVRINGMQPLADGLTSVIAYDHYLGDGVGLETTGGMSVPNPGSLTPVNVSANALLAQLNTDTGMTFGAGHSGSAVLSVNAEGETSLTISDALGRTVMVAQTQPHTQQVGLVAVAWSYMIYDNTHDIGTGGVPFVVEETRSRDAFGNITKSRTDGGGRVIQNVDEAGNISRMTYSATSELLSFRDPNDVGYDATFDQLGRELSRTDTYGIITSTGYDREGNAISQTDGKGQTTQYQYDAANRRTKVIDRLAGNTIYGYDLAGNEISIVDAENQTTLYTYNSRGHRATETFPDHVGGSNPGDVGYGIVAYDYDPMGRSQRRTDQLGDTVTMVYDMASRLLQRDYRTRANSPSGTISDSDVMTHDRMGRMATGVSGRYSNTVAMTYDDIGRPASESLTISGQTYTTSYTHDAMNRRSGLTLPDGSAVLRTFTNRSQLHQAKLDGFTLDTRTYDAGGRHSTSTYGNGVVITHAYRINGSLKDDLLASITTTHPGGIPSGQQVGNYSYTWDANRNKLSESITGVLSGMGFTPVSYDNEERLTAWSRSDGNQSQTWGLSLVGDWNTHTQTGTNPFTQTRVHGPAHEFLAFAGTSAGALTYDVKGNTTLRPATLTAPTLNLTWDFVNQLSGVDTNLSPASQEVSFRYDVLGRRVGRVEGASSVIFVQADQQTIADYVAGQPANAPTRVYVYGSYIDELIARRQSGNLAYFHRNQQYSIVALSDSTGAVVERYSYTAYGQPTIYNAAGAVLAASAFDNRYMYTGREWDATLALHYFRARWYDSLAGRFLSRDPLEYVDGRSLYGGYFVASSVDPSGNQCSTCEVAVYCGPATAGLSAGLGDHCGLLLLYGEQKQKYSIDGQALELGPLGPMVGASGQLGLHVSSHHWPEHKDGMGSVSDEFHPFTDETCNCLLQYKSAFDAAQFLYDMANWANEYPPYAANSNWALNCLMQKCFVSPFYRWGERFPKPPGFDDAPCCKWSENLKRCEKRCPCPELTRAYGKLGRTDVAKAIVEAPN